MEILQEGDLQEGIMFIEKGITLVLATSLLLSVGSFATADTMSVVNTVNVSASTGGNGVSPGGTVTTGKASGSIHIETEVNGEVVEYINEAVNGDASIRKEIVHESEDVSVKTTVDVKAESGTAALTSQASGTTRASTGQSLPALIKNTFVEAFINNTASSSETVVESHAAATKTESRRKESLLASLLTQIKAYVLAFFTW